jgi:hypothetical protein
MDNREQSKLLALVEELRDAGCSCDLMNGYQCGIHKPLAKLEQLTASLLTQHAVVEPPRLIAGNTAEAVKNWAMWERGGGFFCRLCSTERSFCGSMDKFQHKQDCPLFDTPPPAHAVEQPKLTEEQVRVLIVARDRLWAEAKLSSDNRWLGNIGDALNALLTSPVAPPPPRCDVYSELCKPGTDIKIRLECVRSMGHKEPHAYEFPIWPSNLPPPLAPGEPRWNDPYPDPQVMPPVPAAEGEEARLWARKLLGSSKYLHTHVMENAVVELATWLVTATQQARAAGDKYWDGEYTRGFNAGRRAATQQATEQPKP